MRRVLAALALATVLLPLGEAAAQTSPYQGYRVIDLSTVGNQERFTLGANEDVLFQGTGTTRTKALVIEGGRNVAVIGGTFKPQYANGPTATIYTKNQSGSIWIDGVNIDNARAPGMDGIVLNADGENRIPATVRNSSVYNIQGWQAGRHGDVIQPQGRLSELNVFNLKGSTAYQGLFLARQEGVDYGGKVEKINLENVQLEHLVTANSNRQCLYLMSFGGQQQVNIKNVYLTGQPHRSNCRGESMLNLGGADIAGQPTYTENQVASVTGAGGESSAIPTITPTQPGQVAGDPTITNPVPGVEPPPPGTVAPVDPATVPVPEGQPAIPAVPPAFTPGSPPMVYPPANNYVPPTPPPPPPAASVLTNLSNHPILAASPALNVGLLDGLVSTFTNQSKLWESTLTAIATSLFVKLAIIEIIWVVGWATARRESFETILEVIAMQIITIGFFYWLMINTADFILAIIESFGMAANQASIAGGGMTNLGPTDIFAAGLNMTKKIWDGMTIMDLDFSVLLVIAGVINSVVFAKITAKLIEVLIESSFCAYAGIVLMGFGGTRFTRDYAVAVYRYGISVGVKRLFLQLIIGLGQGIITGWATQVDKVGAGDWVTLGIMLGAPLIMWGLADTLPQKAQDIIMGVYTGGSGATIGKGAALGAAAATGAAVGAVGGAVAGKAAFQLAKAQIEQRQQQGGAVAGSRMARAAQMTGMAARNIASAAATDVGKRMNGKGGRYGHRSWRMANDMQEKRSKM